VETLQIAVFDITGKQVSQVHMEGNKMNIAQLEKGIYFIQVKTDTETYPVQKLIKL
jgi:hypothetical protein